MELGAVLAGLDQLFAEARIEEIEPYLLNAYEMAAKEGDYGSMLSITNELIGFSREVCHYDQMIAYGQDALKLIDQMGIQGSVPHATTLLNIANGLRAGGYLERSAAIYDQVEALYQSLLQPGDFGFADLYNNRSLLYQEQEQYELAAENLNKALAIAETYPDRVWEVATTNANLANTYIALAGQDNNPIYLRQAEQTAMRAIAIYEQLGVKDTHFAAAVCALGKVYESDRAYGKAVSCYRDAKEAIRSTLGETDFYRTVQGYEEDADEKMRRAGQVAEDYEIRTEAVKEQVTNRDATEEDNKSVGEQKVDGESKPDNEPELETDIKIGTSTENVSEEEQLTESTFEDVSESEISEQSLAEIKPENSSESENDIHGLLLSEEYYESVGAPMLTAGYSNYYDRMTIGQIGEGSDCYGFDDEYSRDHDWGPGFSIWLEDTLYEEIGERLTQDYEALPKEWKGYERLTLLTGRGRVGVHKTSDYLKYYLGEQAYKEWRNTGALSRSTMAGLESYQLAALCNGRIYHEGSDCELIRLRKYLMNYYDDSTLCILLAEHICRFGQNAQYNYHRMKQRGDDLTAWMMLAEGMKEALKVGYLCNRIYAPHDKWLVKGAEKFTRLPELTDSIRSIYQAEIARVQERTIDSSDVRTKADYMESGNHGMDSFSVEQMIDDLAGMLLEELLDQGYIGNARLIAASDGYYLDNYLEHYGPELQLRSDYLQMSHEELVEYIAKMEFKAFDQVKNEGGRADCQDDWYTFHIMRTSQYTTWTDEMLVQYAVDFQLALDRGWNMIMEKYGRMEASTVPEEWNEIKHEFPEIPEGKQRIMEQIIQIQVGWMEAFAAQYPGMASNARRIHTSEDQPWDTSYETYLRGEMSTYSDKMLKLYGQFIVGLVQEEKNLAYKIMEETVHRYGYADLADAAGKLGNTNQ